MNGKKFSKKLNTSLALTAMFVALIALMVPSNAMAAIGDVINPPGTIVPANPGNGRAIAYDGLTTLYYTNAGDSNIYRSTTAGVDLGPIPIDNRGFGNLDITCGALDYDGTDLWCGTYDFNGDVYTVDPVTGTATFQFSDEAFGGFDGNICFNQAAGGIDGIAVDADGTIWLSDDGAMTLYHLNSDGTLIASFATPSTSVSVNPGCNSGLDVAGDYLELVLLDREVGEINADDHRIVKVAKADPSTVIVEFQTNDPLCCEGISVDAHTFAPLAALWTHNAGNGNIQAYEVQITRTIGYWKNHSLDAEQFLIPPIELGTTPCETIVDAQDVKQTVKAHGGQDVEPKLKAQLLAAKLNVVMGNVPAADLAAIAGTIAAADALLDLNGCNPDTGKKGVDRAAAQALHDLLDEFNNKYSL